MGRKVHRAWMMRTFKREVALLLLLFWAAVTAKVFFWPLADVAMVNALGMYYTTLSAVAMSFSGLAFGMDAWAKQCLPMKGTAP